MKYDLRMMDCDPMVTVSMITGSSGIKILPCPESGGFTSLHSCFNTDYVKGLLEMRNSCKYVESLCVVCYSICVLSEGMCLLLTIFVNLAEPGSEVGESTQATMQ